MVESSSICVVSDAVSRTRRARRDDLIAATIRLVYRDGVSAASVERIAVEAGTSKGTALYHFAGKEEIYSSVVETLFEAGRVYMTERILAAPAEPRHQLEIYVESNLQFILDNVEHVVATQRIAQHTGSVEIEGAVPPLRALLEAGQLDRSFGAFDSEFMAHSIRSVIDSAAYYLPEHPELDGDHFIGEGVALVLRAVGATAPDRAVEPPS